MSIYFLLKPFAILIAHDFCLLVYRSSEIWNIFQSSNSDFLPQIWINQAVIGLVRIPFSGYKPRIESDLKGKVNWVKNTVKDFFNGIVSSETRVKSSSMEYEKVMILYF